MNDFKASGEKQPANPTELRKRAEAVVWGNPELSSKELEALSPAATRQLIHDLHVHQIELEMQNEDLRRAHLAQSISAASYLDLYDFAPVGYCTVDEQGVIRQANLTAAALLGVARDALVAQTIGQFILDADRDIYYLHQKKLRASGNRAACELRLLKPDGTTIWTRLMSAATQDADKNPIYRMVLSDISERKERDAALRLQALVLDQIQDQVTITDLDGVVTYVNQSVKRSFDRPGESMLGRHVSAYGDTPRGDASTQEIAEATLNQGAWNGKIVRALNDGSSLLLDLRTTLIKDDDGKPVAMVGVATDITQRSVIETALRQHEQYLRALFDNFPFMVWLKDRESRFLIVNQALASNHGWPSPQSLIGKSDFDISAPDLAEKYRADDCEVLARGVSKQVEELIESGGQRLWFETYKSPVMIDGEVIGVVGFARDITSRKKREAALKAAMAGAEKANNEKSRFLAAASHDLRQPLMALSLYIGMMKRRASPDEVEIIGSIQDCVLSLSELLTDILDLSKLEARAVRPNLSVFSIDKVLSELLSVHSREAELNGLRLHVRKSGAVVRTDQILLRRLLSNLISNGIKYTKRGGVLVACRHHQGKLWVEVWDTGIGIAEDQIGIIFDEFTQLGNNARTRGSGLGLAIVDKTAKLLKLQLRVRSRLGQGSMFAIELPKGLVLDADEVPQRQYSARPLRIALIDDNENLRNALVRVLKEAGHDVLGAASGAELIEGLGQQAPDLVISDYRLAAPENGFAVIKSVRNIFGQELPAFLITGDTDPNLVRSMADRGIPVHYKPIDIDTLQEIIREVTERSSS